jgi:type I restriction enzyme S subunit
LLSVRAPVGDVNIAQSRCCIGRGISAIRPKQDKLHHLFLFYFLKFNGKKFEALSAGSTFKAIRRREIENYPTPLPPLPEQRRIVSILSTVDEAIQRVDEAIARTERLKRGLMQRLLTRGIGHREFRFSKELGCEIPKEWEVVRFKNICEFKRGFSYRSDQIIKNVVAKIRFITINDLEKEGGLKRTAEKIYLKEEVDADPTFFLNGGDVLIANTDMSKGFIIGAPLLIENTESEKLVYSMDLTKLIFDKSAIYSKFLFHLLKYEAIRRKMKTFAQGTNVLHLNHDLVRSLKIPLPPLPEQRRIAEILSTIDKKLELERNRKTKLERIKRGLMSDLLNGKKRVKA